jgi:hypothetical protein
VVGGRPALPNGCLPVLSREAFSELLAGQPVLATLNHLTAVFGQLEVG